MTPPPPPPITTTTQICLLIYYLKAELKWTERVDFALNKKNPC